MRRIALVIEYDGRGFHGWQRQPGMRTIQATLLDTLRRVTRQPIPEVVASGRTDSGVHAEAQVVSFLVAEECNLWRLSQAVSSIHRGEISVRHASYVSETFHPRRHAIGKRYRYTLANRITPPALNANRMWHIREPLSHEALKEAAQVFVGTHDFSSFQGGGCEAVSPIKTIFEIRTRREGDTIIIEFHGSGFLKHMVRILTGTIVDYCRGKLLGVTCREILERRHRTQSGVTAPPHGLTLERVFYAEQIENIIYRGIPFSPRSDEG
jgi:tRNA pseudouridine38-40 synthase